MLKHCSSNDIHKLLYDYRALDHHRCKRYLFIEKNIIFYSVMQKQKDFSCFFFFIHWNVYFNCTVQFVYYCNTFGGQVEIQRYSSHQRGTFLGSGIRWASATSYYLDYPSETEIIVFTLNATMDISSFIIGNNRSFWNCNE